MRELMFWRKTLYVKPFGNQFGAGEKTENTGGGQ
jgi:hypothetical protein